MKEEKEPTLLDYWRTIWRYRFFILLFFVITVGVTFIFSLLSPKIYRATATILPPQEKRVSGLSQMLGAAGINIQGISQPTSTTDVFMALLKSRRMKDEVINRFDLQKVYKTKTKEEARKKLDRNSEVEISRQEKVIKINVMDTSPERSADIANFYLENLDRLNRELNITSAGQMCRFIEERLKETAASLKTAEEKLETYQVRKKVVSGQEKETAAKTSGELQGNLIAARVRLEALKKYATKNNPEVIKLQNEVKEMEKVVSSLPPVGTELGRLIRDVKVQETIYSLLASQYEQARIEEARDTPTVQILDYATPPEKKYKPKIKLNMAISGVIALIFGIFFSFLYNSSKAEISLRK